MRRSPSSLPLRALAHQPHTPNTSINPRLSQRSYTPRACCVTSQSNISCRSGEVALAKVPHWHGQPVAQTTSRCYATYPQKTRCVSSPANPVIHDVFEHKTGSWQYVVADPETQRAVIIDPVLDYDPQTQAISTRTAESLLVIVKENDYKVDRILETHAHADHITAAAYLQHQLEKEQGYRPKISIGNRIRLVQERFSTRYDVPYDEWGAVFDETFQDDEKFPIGNLQASAIHIPGHTPDHMGYKIGDNVFTGDLIFYKDLGTARADFPGGNASQIFKSARNVLSLPAHTRVWSGHDYPINGRSAISSMTVQEHREQNKHLSDGISEQDFVKMRRERDAVLAAPKLIHPSLQMNIRGGKLPAENSAGQRNFHLPLKMEDLSW